MKKPVKWLLIGLALIVGVNAYRGITTPKAPEEQVFRTEAERKEADLKKAAREEAERKEADLKKAAREEADRKEAEHREAVRKETEQKENARREYFEHPVVMAHNVARKLAGISAEHAEVIQAAVQNFQQYAASKGRNPINVRAVANAALAFDEMAKAYADFDVPMSLPGNTAALLTGARVDLKKSSLAGTEAFLDLQRILEGKHGSLSAVNKKMSETTMLRNKGVKALNEANAELSSMTTPEYPK